ncbi:hypothetical protein TNCV_2214281 [Trichonephila clavipes]|nr:hypothetical protein TNCV_2214281 [Trichonephila clavipes]
MATPGSSFTPTLLGHEDILENEFITNSSDLLVNISINDLIPTCPFSQNSSMDHMQIGVTTERDYCLNHDSITTVIVSFNIVGLVASVVLFPPEQQIP